MGLVGDTQKEIFGAFWRERERAARARWQEDSLGLSHVESKRASGCARRRVVRAYEKEYYGVAACAPTSALSVRAPSWFAGASRSALSAQVRRVRWTVTRDTSPQPQNQFTTRERSASPQRYPYCLPNCSTRDARSHASPRRHTSPRAARWTPLAAPSGSASAAGPSGRRREPAATRRGRDDPWCRAA